MSPETSDSTPDRAAAYAGGIRLALMCVDTPDHRAMVKSGLEERGYTVQSGDTAADALDRMRKNTFEVVVVDEAFQGSTEHDNAVLTALRPMPMSTRRYIFVVLLGRRFGTLDNMTAFARSVNLVVHVSDLSQFNLILARGLADHERFYRAYFDVLQEVGRR